jgi:hypothetical protein
VRLTQIAFIKIVFRVAPCLLLTVDRTEDGSWIDFNLEGVVDWSGCRGMHIEMSHRVFSAFGGAWTHPAKSLQRKWLFSRASPF